ncbi:MAG: metal-dependent hydrolase [Gemmatimonadaceae bacterium]
MFSGHAALSLLGKAARPRVPLFLIAVAAYAPDIVQRVLGYFNQFNRELSHSMPAIGIGATIVALVYWAATGAAADASVLWLAYVSHWFADYITGIKPTWPGGPIVGRVMYLHPGRDALLEADLVLLCWLAYRSTLPADRKNTAITLLIPVVLIVCQLAFDYSLAPGLPRL